MSTLTLQLKTPCRLRIKVKQMLLALIDIAMVKLDYDLLVDFVLTLMDLRIA
jgi:hypothetical protein